MKPLAWIVVLLGLLQGGWMAFDGSRALIVGDYVTPASGQYAGQLGPWSKLVSVIGIEPRSTLMKSIHVGLGAAWLVATVCFLLRMPGAWSAMLTCAVLSLWYLPFGTLFSVVQIVLLLRPAMRGTPLLGLAGAAFMGASILAQSTAVKPAVPVEPIAGILDAFRTHEIVALGDAHGNEQSQAFLKSLVRDPRFAASVNDIVIEFGNARYQAVLDRFVNGEDVPAETLRQVWKNTTIANEIPVDEEFFTVVRQVNATLPPQRRLRILASDPPIDWTAVRTREDHFKWLAMRASFPAALIQTEVLAKQRRALVVYGQLHFQRQNLMSNLDMSDWRMQTIVSLLARATPATMFTVWNVDGELASLQADMASWPAPSLAVVRGTALGAADATVLIPSPNRFNFQGGRPVPIPRDQWRSLRLEDQLDAVLYLGPKAAMKDMPLSSAICADSRYIEERLRRIALTGIPQVEAERVKKLCGG